VPKSRTPGQKLRRILDTLERLVHDTTVALESVEMPGESDLADAMRTPEGLTAWKKQLERVYEDVRTGENEPTAAEAEVQGELAVARQAVLDATEVLKRAHAARRDVVNRCSHRIRLEDPEINPGNGMALYPRHPTCLVCGEEFEYQHYCAKSPELRCLYPNILGKGPDHFVDGDALMQAGESHDGSVECVYCGQPWTRLE